MIFVESLEQFELGKSTSLLKGFTTGQWGTCINLQCLFDPGFRLPYEIKLVGCSEVSWSIHSPENTGEDLLNITDIQINFLAVNRQEFVMFTEIFELIVICEELKVNKSMELHDLLKDRLNQVKE
jgi:hypothetical protein